MQLQSDPAALTQADRTRCRTLEEIHLQPELWPTTVKLVRSAMEKLHERGSDLARRQLVFTGAGTSAYAAEAAAIWPGTRSIPTTDLLLEDCGRLEGVEVLISLARSGDSPESVAVTELVGQRYPQIHQIAVVCNASGDLAQKMPAATILLDPRTNDRSLVMTSSFSNLVLAGLMMGLGEAAARATEQASARAASLLPEIESAARAAASEVKDRIVVLSSSPLTGWGREAALKILEMTSGRYPVLAETFLGLRHGPMSFLRPDTLVLCLLSNDPRRRAYELDLLAELRAKKIGRLIGIADPDQAGALFDRVIPSTTPQMDDKLRTPFEIAAAQLFGVHLSLMAGFNPDSPSPDGVINRVVQGVRIYPCQDAADCGRPA